MRNLILSALFVLLVGVSAAFAVPPCCPALNAAGSPAGDVWSKLNPDQQKQFDSLQAAFQQKLEAFRSSLAAKRNELKDLMAADKLDEQALEAKRQEMWGLQDGLRKDYRQTLTEIGKLLTPEQKRELGPLGLMDSRMLGSATLGEQRGCCGVNRGAQASGQRGCCAFNRGAQAAYGCCGAAAGYGRGGRCGMMGKGFNRGGCCGAATMPPCCRPGGGA